MPNGTLTGNCILGASTHKFSGALDSSSSTPTVATASISVPRTGKSTLTFTFSFDAATGYLTSATLADSAITTPVQGWRNVWNPVPVSTPYAGFYTLAFDPAAAPDPAVPQGNGCAGFTVAANGAITGFSATLADSTAFTLVGNVGPAGEIMLWQSLYAGKGSLQGALDITSGVAPGFTDSTLAGTGIHWTRPSGTGRIYAAGFTDTLLNAVGGRYNAPSATQIVMGCDDKDKNARLEFAEGGVPTGAIGFPPLSPNVELRIKPGGTNLVQTVPNVRATSVTITPGTGLFTGSYTLNDPNVATGKIEPRKASFTGRIVPTGSGLTGFGWFLLPEFSNPNGSPKMTTTTSKMLSGQVSLIKQ
jgi:hypothetical protein